MVSIPTTKEAYKLLHEGVLALSDAEQAGICIDIPYCLEQQKKIREEQKEVEKKFWQSELGLLWKSWAKKYHKTPALGGDQLIDVFTHAGIKIAKQTDNGKMSTDEESVRDTKIPGAEELIQLRKMDKCSGTYLSNLIEEAVDGKIHPMFSLNIPRTYRSSCSNPNLQNFPIRDLWMGRIIRSAVIPRKGHCLVESDYKGLEVATAACYNLDPMLMKYLADKSLDMHRDMAMECFMLKQSQVGKWVRHAAKNKFVFPEFYGSYYKECASALWKAAAATFLEGSEKGLGDPTSVRQHLATKGIKSLAKFEEHIQQVEDRFWNERFKVYTQWKRKHYNSYLKNGYVESLTGFRYSGEMKRTEVINYPIQGSAFHCNLWSFIQLNREMRKNRMKSVLLGQIHDSIIGDIHMDELDDYLALSHEITGSRLKKHWPWIIVDMEVEVEAAPEGKSWFDKKKMELEL